MHATRPVLRAAAAAARTRSAPPFHVPMKTQTIKNSKRSYCAALFSSLPPLRSACSFYHRFLSQRQKRNDAHEVAVFFPFSPCPCPGPLPPSAPWQRCCSLLRPIRRPRCLPFQSVFLYRALSRPIPIQSNPNRKAKSDPIRAPSSTPPPRRTHIHELNRRTQQ